MSDGSIPKHAAETPPGGAARILIVDDDPGNATLLSRLLEHCGHDTRMVHDGIAAVTAAIEYLPNIVLLDIRLPGADGYEVARQIRAIPELAATRLVALTGYSEDEHRQRSKEAGFDYHIVKPVRLDVLRPLIAGDLPGHL